MRVVIAEDLALLREGLVALLRENDIEVVAQVHDGPGLLRAIAGHHPDLAIVDVRLPPTFSDEGLQAAIEARRRQPELGVLVLLDFTAGWAWRRPPGAVRRVACVWAIVGVAAVILLFTWLLTWLLAG
ncbi:MAG TPA: response regulator, partial [Solirubrobacteraceae bacterium]